MRGRRMTIAMALAAATAAAGVASADHRPRFPPRLAAYSSGDQVEAAQGNATWCDGHGACLIADAFRYPRSQTVLVVRPGERVRVRPRFPVEAMTVQRLVGGGPAPPTAPYSPARPQDASGRRWTFKVPNRARGTMDLVLDVRYAGDAGSAQWGIRVRHRAG